MTLSLENSFYKVVIEFKEQKHECPKDNDKFKNSEYSTSINQFHKASQKKEKFWEK